MTVLACASLLLACGLLPYTLTQPTHNNSYEEGFIRYTLWNMIKLPLQEIRDELVQIQDGIHHRAGTTTSTLSCVPVEDALEDFEPRDCTDLYRAGYEESGVYNVNVHIGRYPVPVHVYCDMETDGGGWLVFQRRKDGSLNFFRNWTEYYNGFGDVAGEFWLGNDLLHLLSGHKPQQLRVDLRDHERRRAYARYEHFYVGPQTSDYILNVRGYSGNAGDSLTYHDQRKFSTKDRDNDASESSCALRFKGGWWYGSCHHSNLNGLWAPTGQHSGTPSGEYATWYHWRGQQYSLLFSEMKMRPLSS